MKDTKIRPLMHYTFFCIYNFDTLEIFKIYVKLYSCNFDKEPVGKRIFKSEADWIEQLSVVFSLISPKKPKFVYEVA